MSEETVFIKACAWKPKKQIRVNTRNPDESFRQKGPYPDITLKSSASGTEGAISLVGWNLSGLKTEEGGIINAVSFFYQMPTCSWHHRRMKN